MYQQTTTQGYSTQQQASQVIYATQQYTTVTTQTFHQQQQSGAQNAANAFGLPNDQDSFGDAKDKRNTQQYKAFDWSDSSKFESLRNILPEGSSQQQGGPLPPTSSQPGVGVNGSYAPNPQMYNPQAAGMFNTTPRGPLMSGGGAPLMPTVSGAPLMGTGVPLMTGNGQFFPQTAVPPSPFTVPNNMHPGAMPFTTPSNLPTPMQPSHIPVSNPLYAQQFPSQQFTTPTFPAMTQQQLLQQQLQQQQQQFLQQQQQMQQFGQLPFTIAPQPQLQPQTQIPQQQQPLQPSQHKQTQQQPPQQPQQNTPTVPRIPPPNTLSIPPPNTLSAPTNVPSGVANMVFGPVLASQQAHQTQLAPPQQHQPQQQQQHQHHQPQQHQQQYQPQQNFPTSSSIASSIGSMGSISSMGSITPSPSPISSLNSISSAPSPIPISPPSPAVTARSVTPQLQPPPPSSHHHNRPASVTNYSQPSSQPPQISSGGRSLSPASVPSVIPPVHSSTLSANYSSNVLYTESTSSNMPQQKADTSDDLFFQQMNQEKKRKEEEDKKNNINIQSYSSSIPTSTPQIVQPTPIPATQPQPTFMEKENSLGLLAKPPPGRERARSENSTKAKQREEQARIAREQLSGSPSPYPSSPSPSPSPTGSSSGSAPSTPSASFYPSTPTPSFPHSNPVSPASPAPSSHPSPRISHIPPHISASHPVFPTAPPSVVLSPIVSLPTPPPTTLSSGPNSASGSPHVAPTYPHIPPHLFAQESHFQKVASVDSNIDLMGLEPMTLQEMDERRRAEIEKRVREELEEKHKQEMDKLRKEFEAQKPQDDTSDTPAARQSLTVAPNRARSASHSSALPPPLNGPANGSQTARAPNASQRALPPPPSSSRGVQHVNSPKQPHIPPAIASVPPPMSSPPTSSLPPPSAFTLPPPIITPPSPSLVVDNATMERRAQVKKDLAGIIAKPPAHPHAAKDAHAHALHTQTTAQSAASFSDFNVTFPDTLPPPPEPVLAPNTFAQPHSNRPAPPRTAADRRSASFDVDLFNGSSVACPICGEAFPSERVLAVHIDDSHGLSSVIGPSSKKHVHFSGGANRLSAGSTGPASIERPPVREPSNASLDALDLSFGSPLGKSRSVDDIRSGPKKEDDLGFGFEAFGRAPMNELPKSKSEVETSKEKERVGTLRHHLGKFGRSREKETSTPPLMAKSESQIVDLADFLGTPTPTPIKQEPVKQEKEGSSFFRKGKNSLSNRTHPPRPSILDTDLMTGSPRAPAIDYGKMMTDDGSSKMLMPKKMKKKNFVPFTPDTAALKIQATYKMMLAHKEFKKIIFRTKVVKEMVTTEHTYVESIENVLKTFAVPLRQMAESGKPLISLDDIAVMFARIEDILVVNRALLERLTVRVARWSVVQKIGDVCVEVLSNPINGLDFRKVYNDYTITYNNILETLDRCCREKSAFKKFIQNGEKMFWGSAGNTIQAFFILPVQRITRYILLFKEVIKYTNPTHPDYGSLVATLHEMECICIDVNENQRKEDTEKKRVQTLVGIQSKVEPRLKDLVVDGRYLLREGVISQFDVDDDQIKERYYFLFNDILLVTKKQKQKFLMRLHITLHNVRLKDIPDSQNFLGHVITNAFEMHTPSKTIMFLAQTVEDKEVVLKELGDVIAHAKEANQNQS